MTIKNLQYSAYAKRTDAGNYCSGMETLGDNFIEENEEEAAVVFPCQDVWATTRTGDYVMADNNCEMRLPFPVYKIKRVLLKASCITIQGVPLSDFKQYDMDKGEYAEGEKSFPDIDCTEAFISDKEWKALLKATSVEDATEVEFVGGLGCAAKLKKETAIPYTQGESIIKIPGDLIKYGGGTLFSEFDAYWCMFLKRLLVKYTDTSIPGNKLYAYQYEGVGDGLTPKFYYSDTYDGLVLKSPKDWLFRIEYIPMTSKTKIRARKNEFASIDYLQSFNQRAEINSVSALGKNMYATAQKIGTREITIAKNYTNLADVPPLGAWVRHNGKRYRLVANTYQQTNTIYIRVVHTLSENWASRSKYLAVDQQYRSWNIPQNDILWRNLYWEDFVFVSPVLNENIKNQKEMEKSSVALSDLMKEFQIGITDDVTVDTMFFIKGKESSFLTGVFVPCSTMAFGNSIVFSGGMQDNLSGGLRRNPKDATLCEEVFYCNEDGRLENLSIILSQGIANGSFSAESGETFYREDETGKDKKSIDDLVKIAQKAVPAVELYSYIGPNDGLYHGYNVNAPKKALFCQDFYVDKDPGEALKFTYQIHFVADGTVIVGSKFAEHNPLIKHWKENRKFRLWLCTEYIREGEDEYMPNTQDCYFEHEPNEVEYPPFVCGEYADNDGKTYNNIYELGFFRDYGKELRSDDKYVAWCITDEKNNIYLACNDKTVTTIYFQMTHRRG